MNATTISTVGARIQRMENGKIRNVKARELDADRIRFNWGYHDGARELTQPNPVREQRRGRDWQAKHHDPIYVAGWNLGRDAAEAGEYTGNFQAAWEFWNAKNGNTRDDKSVTAYRYVS